MKSPSHSKHQAILDGARQVFLAHGYSGASMEAIAEAAPVSKPTLYSHFGSKHELFVAVIAGQCETLFSTLSAATLSHSKPEDGLRAIAEAFTEVLYAEDSLALYRLLIAEQMNFPELGEQVYRASAEPFNQLLASYLEALHKHQLITVHDAALSSQLLIGMLHGGSTHFRCLMGLQKGLSTEEKRQLVDGAVNLFLKGHRP